MSMHVLLKLFSLLALGFPLLSLADGAAIAQQQCAGCHALEQPDYAALGIAERSQRQGPPLYYAGNKFRQTWLAAWLQKPVRMRPGGSFPPAHTQQKEEGDRIDASSLAEHIALAAEPARQVAEYLMSLQAHNALLEQDSYQPGKIALRMGKMDFRKFKGCNACHQDAPETGGMSGPELYTAWQRLQPAFISSYIKDPTAWDPHSMMPVLKVKDAAVHKLVNYLKAIGEQ